MIKIKERQEYTTESIENLIEMRRLINRNQKCEKTISKEFEANKISEEQLMKYKNITKVQFPFILVKYDSPADRVGNTA